MLLRSIGLEGWRCFANAVRVGPFGDGLNIVHGPNGIGKSTLMTGLVRAMFDGHQTAGQEIEMLRPAGRDLAPFVEIEFEQDGILYRLCKGFLSRKQAELQKCERGRFERFKEGRGADEFLRTVLGGEEAKRGASKSQHWGFAQLLWVPQGELALKSLTGSAKDLLQQALGVQLTNAASTNLENKILERYDAIYTPSGKLKGGLNAPKVVQLEQQFADAAGRLIQLRERLSAFEAASRKIEDLNRLADQAIKKEQGLSEALEKARSRSQEFVECSSQCDTFRQEVVAAHAKAEELGRRIQAIEQFRRDIAEDESRIGRLQADHPLLQADAARCEAQATQARTHAETVRGRRQEIDKARQLAADAAILGNAAKRSRQLIAQIDAVQLASAQLARLREDRVKVIAPTPKQLSVLRKVNADLREARVRLEASLLTLQFEAEQRITVQTVAGDPPGEHALEPGQRLVIRGAPETALRLPGIGTIRATGPAQSADVLRDELAAAESQWKTLFAGYGAFTLDELEQNVQQAHDLDRQILEWQTRLDTTLSGHTVEQLQSELKQCELTIDEVCQRHDSWRESAPLPQDLSRAAERLEQEFRIQIDDAEAKASAAMAAHTAAAQKLSLHDAEIHSTLQKLALSRKRLEQAADGLDDATRASRYRELLLDHDTAKAKLARAAAELQSFPSDPRKEYAALDKQAGALRHEAAKALESLHREDAVLQQLAREAPYSMLSAAEENLVSLQTELQRERLQADAIKLLHDTLTQVKSESLQAVIEPVKRRAQQTLHRIAGGKFEGITFDEELLPNGLCTDSVRETAIALDQLSGGEREQVYFAVRLALADVAFHQARELLVLDDVFVYTDMARFARIVCILEEAAERFQIVLLTCHPERYRGIPSARFFDLEALVNGHCPVPPRDDGEKLERARNDKLLQSETA